MKILLTGATGFVGNALGRRLIREGHELVILSRDPLVAKEKLPYPAQILPWSNLNAQLMTSVGAVIHLAGESIAGSRWNERFKAKVLNSRVKTTRALVDALNDTKENSPHTFICASAVGFYGDRGDEMLLETSPDGSGFLAEVCRSWEAEASRAHGQRTVILRLGVVLGAQGGMLQKLIPIFRNRLGGTVGSGKQWMSWVHIDDLVELIVHCLKSSTTLQGPVNVASPNPVTNAEMTRTLGDLLGVNPFFKVPAFALKFVLGEMSSMVLNSQRISAQKAISSGFEPKYITFRQALEQILTES